MRMVVEVHSIKLEYVWRLVWVCRGLGLNLVRPNIISNDAFFKLR
jgi:hypothetical protein